MRTRMSVLRSNVLRFDPRRTCIGLSSNCYHIIQCLLRLGSLTQVEILSLWTKSVSSWTINWLKLFVNSILMVVLSPMAVAGNSSIIGTIWKRTWTMLWLWFSPQWFLYRPCFSTNPGCWFFCFSLPGQDLLLRIKTYLCI